MTRHNYPEAETYLKKAILLGPQSPDAYLYLGQMYFDDEPFRRGGNCSSSMHPSYDGCFAESISGPEGAFSSGQNPDARRVSRMQRTRRWISHASWPTKRWRRIKASWQD